MNIASTMKVTQRLLTSLETFKFENNGRNPYGEEIMIMVSTAQQETLELIENNQEKIIKLLETIAKNTTK